MPEVLGVPFSSAERVPTSSEGAAAGELDLAGVFRDLPTAYLVMTPDLEIAAANDAYLRLVGRSREELVGRQVFDAFPPTEHALDEQGRNPVQVSFSKALGGVQDRLPLQQYDVLEPATGRLVQRFWSLISAPVRGADGQVVLLLQRVEDVTDYVAEQRQRDAERTAGRTWRRRVEAVEADLFGRAQELRAAVQAQEVASRRLSGLAEAALRLAAVDTVEQLVETVIASGLTALGADGGAVAVRHDPEGVVRVMLTASLGEPLQSRYADLPLGDRLPAAWAARTGEAVLLPDLAAATAWSPELADVHASSGREAWAALPLRVGDRLLGSLTASWSQPHAFSTDETDLLAAFAAQCAQALDRLQVRQAEQRAAAASRRMSEALQRSLLTEPQEADHLEIVVRYRAAAEQVQIGGDWYDAFLTRDGSTCIVIGDVTGHDREAAAVMGQIRNLLRGIAYTLGDPPAGVVSALDRAMLDLEVAGLATAVLAKVEQSAEQAERGERTLRWTNAGHPPPLLLRADGTASLLHSEPDLLLGLDPDTPRSDSTVDLQPGDSVLLYTDGLVERRGASLDEGLAWLAGAAAERAHLTPDELCDELLGEVVEDAEDDIALLVLRAHPEDRPRPHGPGRLPRHLREDAAGTQR